MKHRKWLTFILILLVAGSLSGCGKNDPKANNDEAKDSGYNVEFEQKDNKSDSDEIEESEYNEELDTKDEKSDSDEIEESEYNEELETKDQKTDSGEIKGSEYNEELETKDQKSDSDENKDSRNNEKLERINPKKLAMKEAEQIFEYLKNEDVDNLIPLFSEEVKEKYDLEKEWQDFFDAIDGKIVEYKDLSFPGEGMGIDQDGNIFDSHLSVTFNNLVTDKGVVYENFGYYQVRINTANPRSEGINVFSFKVPETQSEYIIVGLKD